MLTIPHAYCRLSRLPAVPSRVLTYKGTSTTTTDEDTSTFTGIDIGTPHPLRAVVLAVYHGVGGTACTVEVNSIPEHGRIQANVQEFSTHLVRVPIGTTATIAVTATGSLRKAVAVYVCYPLSWVFVDSGVATANTTSNAVISDLKVVAGGWVIYAGGQHGTLGTFTTTWSGTEAVTEDVDAQLEAAASYTMGHIDITESADLGDLTLAESASGTKRLNAISIWPPPP